MPDPVNYLSQIQPIAPVNPLQSFTQGMGVGQSFAQQRLAAEQQRLANEQAAADAARQAQISDAFAKLSKPGATAQDYMNLAMMLPEEQSKAIRESFSLLQEEERQNVLTDSASVYAALESGNNDIAVKLLKNQAAAIRNSGDPSGADNAIILDDWANLIQRDDAGAQSVKQLYGLTISMMPKGKEAIDAVAKFGEESRAKAAEPTVQLKRLVDIGLTDAQAKKVLAETKLLDQEFIQTAGELELAKKSGGLDPEKKFASELSLNKEYETRTRAYNESLRLNSVIKDSAAAATGAGDLALINTFMKMLDPGSVVRESEFAQAQDTSGLISKLAASLGKVKNGEVLVPAQRTEFARLANQYMTAAGVHEKKVRDSLNFMVESYGLNPKNVFGTMADGATTTPETATGTTGTTGAATTGTTGAAAVPKAAETVKTGGF